VTLRPSNQADTRLVA